MATLISVWETPTTTPQAMTTQPPATSRRFTTTPSGPWLGTTLATPIRSLSRSPDAIAAYKEALRVKPDYADVHLSLGSLYVDQGDKDSAMKEYQALLDLKSSLSADLLAKIQK